MKASLEDMDIWELHAMLALGICSHKQWNICDDCRLKIQTVINKKRTDRVVR